MISYAQNYEDVLLARAFGGKADGFYIDVGAADPVEHSVTKHFSNLGWRGVNVEPLRGFCEKLAADRPRDITLQAALGAAHEERTFFNLGGAYLSTLDPDRAGEASREGIPCTEERVEVLTLAEVCERHAAGVEIDFLKIDVEGWEEAVIRGGDWHRFRPRVVVVEATEPNTPNPSEGAWEPLLLEAGYLFAHFDGLNRFYVRREDEHLVARFALQPNVFDKFVPHREKDLEEKLVRTYAERDELSDLYGHEREAHALCRTQRDEYYHDREETAKKLYDVTQERDGVAWDRDQKAHALEAVTREREELAHRHYEVTQERDHVTRERDQLTATLAETTRARDALDASLTAVTGERDELTRQRNNLSAALAATVAVRQAVVAERDGLRAECETLTDERDALLTEKSVLEHRVAHLHATLESRANEVRHLTRHRDEIRTERDAILDERNHLDCRARHLQQLLDELHASRFWRSTAWLRSLGTTGLRAGRKVKRLFAARPAPAPQAVVPPAPAPAEASAPAAPPPARRSLKQAAKQTAKKILRKTGGGYLIRLIERRILAHVAPMQARDHEAAERIARLEAEIARLHQRALLTEMCLEAVARPAEEAELPAVPVAPGRNGVHRTSHAA